MSGMSATSAWIVVIAVGVFSFLFRISMLALSSRMELPAGLDRAAKFAGPAAFGALAATALAHQVRAGSIAPVIAVAAAVIAVRRTGKPQVALLAGMPAFWLVSALGSWLR